METSISFEAEAGKALSQNKQCHSREGGNLVLEMRCLIKEVPAFLHMDAQIGRAVQQNAETESLSRMPSSA